MPLKVLPIRIRIHIQSKNSNWMDIPIRIHPIFLQIHSRMIRESIRFQIHFQKTIMHV